MDTRSVLLVASSICIMSGENEEIASNNMGGMNTIPIPRQSITTDIIEVIAITVTLFTCY